MAAARVSIPAAVRRTIQNIKEIAGNHTDEEVYAALRECDMDPNETTRKLLLLQDTFHGVKIKRDKKKESNKESADPRWRPGTQGRGGKGGRGNYSARQSSNSSDGTGRNALAGKENDLNPSMDKCSSSSAVNPSRAGIRAEPSWLGSTRSSLLKQRVSSARIVNTTSSDLKLGSTRLSGRLSNGPSQTPAPKAKNSLAKGTADLKSTPEVVVVSLGSHVSQTSTSVSDSVLTPSIEAHSECEIIANKHASRSQWAAGLVSDDVSAGPKDQLCQGVAATATHLRSDVAPSADLADGILLLLPDDLLVEILSRLPVKPVHRFKCVSKSWRDLISDPHHRKRFPQALAGLFYWSWCCLEKGREEKGEKLQFINFSARGLPPVNPALVFLPNHASIVVEDCCNGLLLLFSSYSQPRDYVVCNPATEKWVALPNSGVTGEIWHSRLAFDPAVSVHFHVLEYVDEDPNGAVGIYSSRTGGWSHTLLRCTSLFEDSHIPGGPVQWTAFLNGMLHFLCDFEVMSVDLETKEWRHIRLPVAEGETEGHWNDFFGQSDRSLVYVCSDQVTQSFWILEDYDSGAWSLKHRVSLMTLFGGSCGEALGAFHPHCNILFYPGEGRSVMSYDFDRGELRRIAAPDDFCTAGDGILPYVPYFGDFGA